jgi:hypothetical protein
LLSWWSRRNENPLWWRNPLRVVVVSLGAYSAWKHRYHMNPDGISYLDLGDAIVDGDWAMALNTYWNPLYPLVLALVRGLTCFSAQWEFQAAHLANFLVFLGAFLALEFLLAGMIRGDSSVPGGSSTGGAQPQGLSPDATPGPSAGLLICAAYGLFAWSAIRLVGLYYLTPDACVGLFSLLMAGMLVRFRQGQTGVRAGIWLGLCAGLGYLTKAAMLYVGLGFLCCGWLAAGGPRRGYKTFASSLAVFALIVGSYSALLSWDRGYLTYSDSGKLAEAWLLNGVRPFAHAHANQRRYGTLVHPPRLVHRGPPVYEFATPIRATYPLWFDAPYWYEGITPQVDWQRRLRQVERNWAKLMGLKNPELLYLRLFAVMLLMGLFTAGQAWWRRLLSLGRHYYLVLPAVAPCLMYLTINVENRYLGPFVLLALLSILYGIHVKPEHRRSLACVAGAVAVVFFWSLGTQVKEDNSNVMTNEQWQVAQHLRRLGLEEGDPVGHIGYTFGAYWARLGRYRIVSEIPRANAPAFWRTTAARRTSSLAAFQRSGAKVVVCDGRGRRGRPREPGPGWIRLAESNLYAYFFEDSTGDRAQTAPADLRQ